MAKHQTVEEYIAALPEASRQIIERIRAMALAVVPGADEAIRYDMPSVDLGGRHFLYYAAWKTHVALYPIYRGAPDFEKRIAAFRDKKDTVRFPLNRPVPYDVVEMIVREMAGRGKAT